MPILHRLSIIVHRHERFRTSGQYRCSLIRYRTDVLCFPSEITEPMDFTPIRTSRIGSENATFSPVLVAAASVRMMSAGTPAAIIAAEITSASVRSSPGVKPRLTITHLNPPEEATAPERRYGWPLGSSPSFVLVDKGVAATLNTTTLRQDVYAMTFGQTGLMGGIGLDGAKITRIHPNS